MTNNDPTATENFRKKFLLRIILETDTLITHVANMHIQGVPKKCPFIRWVKLGFYRIHHLSPWIF